MVIMNSDIQHIRVMTIDDHEIMRDGIRYMLMAFDDLELVGEARRGEDAAVMCQETEADVVLVDMRMSGMDGVETTATLKQACPRVNVVMLTSFHDPITVRRAMQAGAVGYLLKDCSKEELAAAIRAAKVGRITLSPEAAADLIAVPSNNGVQLTPRECEVLALLAKGLSNKEIAKRLHRSPFTVRHHVSQLIHKLDAANRAEVAAIAVQRGLIPK